MSMALSLPISRPGGGEGILDHLTRSDAVTRALRGRGTQDRERREGVSTKKAG